MCAPRTCAASFAAACSCSSCAVCILASVAARAMGFTLTRPLAGGGRGVRPRPVIQLVASRIMVPGEYLGSGGKQGIALKPAAPLPFWRAPQAPSGHLVASQPHLRDAAEPASDASGGSWSTPKAIATSDGTSGTCHGRQLGRAEGRIPWSKAAAGCRQGGGGGGRGRRGCGLQVFASKAAHCGHLRQGAGAAGRAGGAPKRLPSAAHLQPGQRRLPGRHANVSARSLSHAVRLHSQARFD